MNLDSSLLAGANVLSLDPVIQIGVDGTQAIIPSLDGIQLQLTNTINGQPGLQITGLDPSMIGQPLPLQIDNNILAQLQQSGNVNITFNANPAASLTGPSVSLTDPNLIQVTTVSGYSRQQHCQYHISFVSKPVCRKGWLHK